MARDAGCAPRPQQSRDLQRTRLRRGNAPAAREAGKACPTKHAPPDARQFALDAHGDQKYGLLPYHVHLDAVAEIAGEYGEVARTVAYLHDVVEDTAVPLRAIEDHFGKRVADCVSILTDEPGANRRERKKKTYSKMAVVSGELELALIVKAADRLANIRASVADGNEEMLGKYKAEHRTFRESAYRQDLCDVLWQEMDAICGI